MNALLIRTATADDIEQLRVFEQGVIEAERPYNDSLKTETIHYYDIETLISDDNVELVVGEVEQQIVACGYAKISRAKAYLQYAFYSYLGFMYVAPEYRGLEINKKLINHLAQWSQAQGIEHLHLDVYQGNSAAIRAYQKCGFTPYLLDMRLALKQQN